MLAHAQKEFRAAGREEKAKQVATSVEMKVVVVKAEKILPPGGTFEDG